MFYILNVYNIICYLYLNKAGKIIYMTIIKIYASNNKASKYVKKTDRNVGRNKQFSNNN